MKEESVIWSLIRKQGRKRERERERDRVFINGWMESFNCIGLWSFHNHSVGKSCFVVWNKRSPLFCKRGGCLVDCFKRMVNDTPFTFIVSSNVASSYSKDHCLCWVYLYPKPWSINAPIRSFAYREQTIALLESCFVARSGVWKLVSISKGSGVCGKTPDLHCANWRSETQSRSAGMI
jgi:hypothetical protein